MYSLWRHVDRSDRSVKIPQASPAWPRVRRTRSQPPRTHANPALVAAGVAVTKCR